MNTTDRMAPVALAQQTWSRHHRTLPADLFTSDIDAILTASGRLVEGIWMSFFDRKPFLLYDLADQSPDRRIRRRAMRNLADRAGLPCVTISWRENDGETEYTLLPRNESGLAALQDGTTMTRATLVAWMYRLRGVKGQDAAERSEVSGWREDLAARFRRWEPEDLGFACTGGGDEDTTVVGLLELKQRDHKSFDADSAQFKVIQCLACAGGVVAIGRGYRHRAAVPATEETIGHTETWEFTCAGGQSRSEREFVGSLWRLRGAEPPADLLARLAGPRRRVG